MSKDMEPDSSLPLAQPLGGSRQRRRPLRGFLRGFVRALGLVVLLLLLAWASLAVHFSNLPWPAMRTPLAVAFAVFGAWALWFARRRGPRLLLAGLFGLVAVWWSTIEPTHDRK